MVGKGLPICIVNCECFHVACTQEMEKRTKNNKIVFTALLG